MNTSLFSRILSDNDADAALLDAWLAERDADLALREVPDAEPAFTVDSGRLAAAAAPFDGNVKPGQIRILSPTFISGDGAIPYVAVLDRWMEDMWLVAPYSPYSYPASEGEMASGDMLVGRRVLQCWNARTAHESLVSQSYVAGSLDESVRKNALALFRHVTAGSPLPDSFAALVGAPVLSKADPRREYLAESAVRYAPLTQAARHHEEWLALVERMAKWKDSVRTASFVRLACFERREALAAGDKAREMSETFRVPAFGVELDVKHSPDEGKVRLVVYGPDGERDKESLQGFAVVDKDGTPVGTIAAGVLVAEASALADGFLILDPETLEQVSVEPKGN